MVARALSRAKRCATAAKMKILSHPTLIAAIRGATLPARHSKHLSAVEKNAGVSLAHGDDKPYHEKNALGKALSVPGCVDLPSKANESGAP